MDELKSFLDRKVREYNQPLFIASDPVSVPHLFSKKQDIEIAGLFAALFAWGNRTAIINKSVRLMELMDMSPHDFIMGCQGPARGSMRRYAPQMQSYRGRYGRFPACFHRKRIEPFQGLFFFFGRRALAYAKTYRLTQEELQLQKAEYVFKMDGEKRQQRR